ncbi:MAG: alpha-L-glutamate ligase-like protein [Deltaproteobacteria bacterium]|nr:alpha-L-glutamate ligase-like protein [Deltaproteobacteria bacterium]
MGINRRNAEFISRYNPRRLYPVVDDKLITKRIAEKAGIAVPELIGVIRTQRQVRDLETILAGAKDFVIKPASGSGGKGLVVISGRLRGAFREIDGHIITEEALAYHVINILSGIYSLGGHDDKALIERRVVFDPVFDKISYLGVPDIRIIVFLGVPVMAMVRLPTKASRGKANLHQGAIGAGICVAKGETIGAVWRNDIITEHPDTGESVIGVKIPLWEQLLKLAASSYELTGLGYQGVDIVLDKDRGPLILELNARPGLNIQIANFAGLLPRLRVVQARAKELTNMEERIALANSFAHSA